MSGDHASRILGDAETIDGLVHLARRTLPPDARFRNRPVNGDYALYLRRGSAVRHLNPRRPPLASLFRTTFDATRSRGVAWSVALARSRVRRAQPACGQIDDF